MLPRPVPWRPGCALASRFDFAPGAGNSEASEQMDQVRTWNPLSAVRRSHAGPSLWASGASDLEALGLKS